MANQFDLFAGAPPKSHHAAKRNDGAVIVNKVAAALKIAGRNGLNADEAAKICNLYREQAKSALSELRLFGDARKTDMKRSTVLGGFSTVYVWAGS